MTDRTHRLSPAALDDLLLDTSPYLSCEDCFDQIDTYIEQLLEDPSRQDIPMQVHLKACAACAEEAETLVELLSGRSG